MAPTREEITTAIDAIAVWRHRIRLPRGVVTPGTEDTDAEWQRLAMPTRLDGRTVLDVGCSDGYYTFRCESLGATVTAIDDESSLLGGAARLNGFGTAARLLGSHATYLAADVERLADADTGRFDTGSFDTGSFDTVLFLNVLYHLPNPMRALSELARVTRPGGELVLKTHFRTDVRVWVRGRCVQFDLDRRPKWWYFPTTELGGDPTNWWSPSRSGLRAMLDATGWGEIEHLTTVGDRLYLRARRS